MPPFGGGFRSGIKSLRAKCHPTLTKERKKKTPPYAFDGQFFFDNFPRSSAYIVRYSEILKKLCTKLYTYPNAAIGSGWQIIHHVGEICSRDWPRPPELLLPGVSFDDSTMSVTSIIGVVAAKATHLNRDNIF
jgi:hypothetical protein